MTTAAVAEATTSLTRLLQAEGTSYEEIAASLERPVGTIKTWLHRARLEVLEKLKHRGMVSEVENELH